MSLNTLVVVLVFRRYIFSLFDEMALFPERDLKLTRLSAIIYLYLAKFVKHNKPNTVYLHEIVIIFFSRLFMRDHLCD